MSTTGKHNRNDPCYCESGKKYKKCHDQTDEEQGKLVRNFAQKAYPAAGLPGIIQQVVNSVGKKPLLQNQARDAVLTLRLAFLNNVRARTKLDYQLLEDYLGELEDKIAEIVGSYRVKVLFQFSCLIPPVPIEEASWYNVLQYREILHLAILKYGGRNLPGKQAEESLVSDEALIEWFTLEHLAYEFFLAAVAYGRVSKSNPLVAKNSHFVVEVDAKEEELYQKHRERELAYRTVGARYGFLLQNLDKQKRDRKDAAYLVPFLMLNVLGYPDNTPAPHAGTSLVCPNHVWGRMEKEIELLHDILLTKFRTEDPEEFDVLLATLCTVRGIMFTFVDEIEFNHKVAIFVDMGCRSFNRSDFAAFTKRLTDHLQWWWEYIRGEQIGDAKAKELTEKALERLTYLTGDEANISLRDRVGHKIFLLDGQNHLVDYRAEKGTINQRYLGSE